MVNTPPNVPGCKISELTACTNRQSICTTQLKKRENNGENEEKEEEENDSRRSWQDKSFCVFCSDSRARHRITSYFGQSIAGTRTGHRLTRQLGTPQCNTVPVPNGCSFLLSWLPCFSDFAIAAHEHLDLLCHFGEFQDWALAVVVPLSFSLSFPAFFFFLFLAIFTGVTWRGPLVSGLG